jgi:hypothetical protein
MLNVTQAVLVAATTATLIASPARADVSWDFTVTEAATWVGAVDPASVGSGILTVSDAAFLRGSVSYGYSIDPFNEDLHVTGDTDFFLGLPGQLAWPSFDPGVYPVAGGGRASISLIFALDGEISGNITGTWTAGGTIEVYMNIQNSVVTDASWGSDGGVPGCGAHACSLIAGYWQLTSPLPEQVSAPVPEPGTLVLLGGMLGLLGFRDLRHRFCPEPAIGGRANDTLRRANNVG